MLLFFIDFFLSQMLFPETSKHKVSVLVHSGCYNKMPLMCSLLTRALYLLQFWRLGSPRSRCQCGHTRAFFLVHSQGLSLCPSYDKTPRIYLEPLFLKTLIHSRRIHPHNLNTSQMPQLQMPSSLGVRIQTYKFGIGVMARTFRPQQSVKRTSQFQLSSHYTQPNLFDTGQIHK